MSMVRSSDPMDWESARDAAASVIQGAWRNRRVLTNAARRLYNTPSYRDYVRFTPPASSRRAPPKRKTNIPRARNVSMRASGGGTAPVISRKKKFSKKTRRGKKVSAKKKYRKSGKPKNPIIGRQEAYRKVKDLQAVYVGHSTVAMSELRNNVARSITKAFWIKEGFYNIEDTSLGPNFETYYDVEYYATPTATSVIGTSSVAIAPNSNFVTHAIAVANMLAIIIGSADRKYDFRLISWRATTSNIMTHRFNCNNSLLKGSLKSILSFQNATPNAIGTNSTDVNNANPLQVTPYYGKGNGTYWVQKTDTTATYQSFVADTSNNHIAVIGSEVSNGSLNEPPVSKFFQHANAGKKFVLQPGAIFKSVCYTPIDMSISKFINLHVGNGVTDLTRIGFGCHKFYGCEKVVTTTLDTGLESDVKITVDMELDNSHIIACHLGRKYYSAPVNAKVQLPIKG